MAGPISPLPVNAIISIQPVNTAMTGSEIATQKLVAQLADGTVVSGYVVNRDPQNNPIIRTDGGDYVIHSNIFVKTGSDVVLRMDPSVPDQAHILSIDHLTPEEYTASNSRGLSEDTIEQTQFKALSQAMQTPASQTTSSTTYPVLRAVLLQTFATPAALPGQPVPTQTPPALLAQAAAGTALNVTIYDVKLPPIPISLGTVTTPPQLANLLPPQNNPQAATPATQTPLISSSSGSPQLSSLTAPLVSAYTALEPQNSTLPSQAGILTQSEQTALLNQPPAPASPPTPQTGTNPNLPLTTNLTANLPQNAGPFLQATVIGHGEDGTSIVHTPFGTLKLDAAQPLPTNTTITLTVQPATTLTPPIPITPPLLPQSLNFNYLTTALAQLDQTDAILAKDIGQRLPVMGSRFTSGMLFFLAAVKSGDRKAMLNAADLAKLEAAMPGLLSQLTKDIKELHQQFTHSRFEEWKPVELPFIFGNNAENAQLYIRKDAPESEAKIEKTAAGQRFLLDLHLSELGDMQLDGFVRQSDRGNSLELFLRSAAPLESTVSEHIRTLFITATETVGMPGNIVFQQGPEHFVKPQPSADSANNGSAPNTILA